MNKITTIIGLSFAVFFLIGLATTLTRSMMIGFLDVIPVYILMLEDLENVFFYVIMFILIFFTHRENIKRLKNKEETKTKIY